MLDVQLVNGGHNNTDGDKPIAQPSLNKGPASLGREMSLYTHTANLPSPSLLWPERDLSGLLWISLSATVCWVFSQVWFHSILTVILWPGVNLKPHSSSSFSSKLFLSINKIPLEWAQESEMPGFQSHLCHFLVMRAWVNCLISLFSQFLRCKIRMITTIVQQSEFNQESRTFMRDRELP